MQASTSSIKAKGGQADVYFLNRDWESSARLHLQHFACRMRMRYLIHPNIAASLKEKVETPRILDLATGTGIWAIEAAREYPNAVITTLDITDNQLPPLGTLPKNVTFSKYNFFDPVPPELAGTFDVVHVAFITVALLRGGRDTVIKHIKQFLKPGGWIQWRDVLNDPDLVVDPKTGQKGAARLQVIEYVEKELKYMSSQDWYSELPNILAEVGGFVDTHRHVPELDPTLLNMETQLLVWSCHELLTTASKMIGTEEAKQGATEAAKDLEGLIKAGMMLHWSFLVAIGRKPE